MGFDTSNVENIESKRAFQVPRTSVVLRADNLGIAGSHGAYFHGLNFEVPTGGVFALEGATSNARTLLLNICSLVEVNYEGSLMFEGIEMKELNDRDQNVLRRFHLGLVPLKASLIDVLNVQENIEYVLNSMPLTTHDRQEQTNTILRGMGMFEHRYKRPHQLSRDQKQRVAIGRSLSKRPRLLCLDDPTAELEGAAAVDLIDSVLSLARSMETTCFISSDDPSVLVRAGRVLRLS